MRRAGLFQAVWIDADRIRVRMPDDDFDAPPQRLSRPDGERLVVAWREDLKQEAAKCSISAVSVEKK
jgi:hypothetical protein